MDSSLTPPDWLSVSDGAVRCEAIKFLGAHLATRLFARPAMGVHGFVACDDAQPATKGVLRSFLAKAIDVGEHGFEYFLNDVGDIIGRHVVVFTPMKNQWRIQTDQSFPVVLVVFFETGDQAARGGINTLRVIA